MSKINNHSLSRGMRELEKGKPTKAVKIQTCFIMLHEKGHPVKEKGQFLVYSSRFRAMAANFKSKFVIKKLTIEL